MKYIEMSRVIFEASCVASRIISELNRDYKFHQQLQESVIEASREAGKLFRGRVYFHRE